MKNLMIGCLFVGLFAMGATVLYACGSHEVNAADAIADVLGQIPDTPGNPSGLEITTQTYDKWTSTSGEKGKETIIKKGNDTVRVYPSGDHQITAEYIDANGNKTTEHYSTEFDVPNIGRFIQDHFPVSKDTEEQEYSG